jgi:hypothetical protein
MAKVAILKKPIPVADSAESANFEYIMYIKD